MDYPISDTNARLNDGKFSDGDPVQAIPPSKDSAAYQNAVYDELLNVITGGQLVPSENEFNQVFLAIQAIANTIANSVATSITTQAITDLIGGAPGALDTLNELAAALADDASYATTIANALAGKANSSHGHAMSSITGLQIALDEKASSSHAHSMNQVSGLETALSDLDSFKASVNHSHSINGVSGLENELNNIKGKFPANYYDSGTVSVPANSVLDVKSLVGLSVESYGVSIVGISTGNVDPPSIGIDSSKLRVSNSFTSAQNMHWWAWYD